MALITRKQWGAKYADGFRDRPLPITEWWLHHSVTIAPDLLPPFTDDDAAVRTLERIGQERFKGGISYTYPCTPVGRIYQGHSLHRQGAHTLGHNTVGGAFVLVGDYRKRPPTPEQREAIARRMVEDHRAGRATRHTLNGGHRQASKNIGSTECPGDAAIAAIPAINARANALWAAGYPSTPAGSGGGSTTSPTPGGASGGGTFEEDDMPEPRDLWAYKYKDRQALGYLVTADANARAARQNSAESLGIMKALAAKPQGLSPEEITAAAKEGAKQALAEEIDGATVNLEVNP